MASVVKKIVVEEFNNEGDLVKRTTTEYDDAGRTQGGSDYSDWVYKSSPWLRDNWFTVENPQKYYTINVTGSGPLEIQGNRFGGSGTPSVDIRPNTKYDHVVK